MTETLKPNRAKLCSLFHLISKTQEGFAEALTHVSGTPLTQQAVSRWLKRESVPAEWCPHVVKASRGQIAPHDLRPDIFRALG